MRSRKSDFCGVLGAYLWATALVFAVAAGLTGSPRAMESEHAFLVSASILCAAWVIGSALEEKL